jgi:cell division protein FtsN
MVTGSEGAPALAIATALPMPSDASALSQPAPQAARAPTEAEPVSPQQESTAPSDSPLSLNPEQAPAPAKTPVRAANASPVASAQTSAAATRVIAYAVQIASQKSESGVKAAYQAIARKFPNVLQGQNMFVYSINLGAKGTYYRAMVGPYSVAAEASQVCSALKSAGGSCILESKPTSVR